MDRHQELFAYYCGRLRTEWARKKALAYLRILAEAEGDAGERREEETAVSAAEPRPRPAPRSES